MLLSLGFCRVTGPNLGFLLRGFVVGIWRWNLCKCWELRKELKGHGSFFPSIISVRGKEGFEAGLGGVNSLRCKVDFIYLISI